MKFNPKGTNIEKFELNGDVYELNYDRLNQLRMDAAETFEKRLMKLGKKAAKELKKERKRKGQQVSPKVLDSYKNTKAYVAEWHLVDEDGKWELISGTHVVQTMESPSKKQPFFYKE